MKIHKIVFDENLLEIRYTEKKGICVEENLYCRKIKSCI